MSVPLLNEGRRVGVLAILAAVWAAILVLPLRAQEDATSPTDPPSPLTVSGPIQYVGPDTYILLDAEGRPQPVLGMSYEEFVEAWKKSQQIESAPGTAPRYTIEELRVTGRALDGHAEVEVRIDLRTRAAESLQIPLGMAAAILRDEPRWERDGNGDGGSEAAAPHESPRIEFDRNLSGFIASIPSGPPTRYTVTLPMLVPLARDGNQTNFRLNFPRSLVSRLAIDVPTTIVDATASDGSVLTRRATGDQSMQIEVAGLVGELNLAWSTAETQGPELASVLTATGQIAISIDGHSIRTDAHLMVSSYGGAFDRFRVRLPPGAELVQNPSNDAVATQPLYRLTLEDRSAASRSREARVVLVELAEKQVGPVEIVLATEQPLGLPGDEPTAQMAGFEVIGAVRQYGDVSIHVDEDLQLRWQAGPYVRQVERADLAEPLAARPTTVAFQYDRQPWSLQTRVAARPLRVHVTPQYSLEVDPTEARLRAKLTYQVPGARVFEFRILLNGWELTADPIDSNGLIDRDRVVVSRDGVLELPLAQATSRRVEVAFMLRRDLEDDAQPVTLPLPLPEVETVADAELSVASGAGVELAVDLAQSRGLSPVPITAESAEPVVQYGNPVMRYRTFLRDAQLVAERTLRTRDVVAEVTTDLALGRRKLTAAQTIDFAVRNQPLDRITLEVPPRWTIADGLVEIVPHGGGRQSAAGRESAAQSLLISLEVEIGGEESGSRQLHLHLPQPLLGRFAVHVKFRAATPEDLPGVGPFECLLPQPSDVQVTKNRVLLTGDNLVAALDRDRESSTWIAAAGELVGNREQTAEFISTGREPTIPLLLRPSVRDLPQATAIQRVWIQTWRIGNTIQDRAAFRFETANTLAVVELPPQVPPDGVEVLLDGALADVAARDEGRLSVVLPAAADDGKPMHTLELRYRRTAISGVVTRERLTPPQLVGSSALNEVVWHVVLPGECHVVQSPVQMVSAAHWQWLDTFLGRRPLKSQSDLESWVGATSQAAPVAGHSEYLYSGLGPVASIELVVAPRWLIVLAASALVLAAVLTWLYVPAVHRPWAAIVAAALIAALAVAYPEPAIFFAQASVIGWIAATIAVALKRRTGDSTVRQSSATAGSTNLRFRPLSRPESIVTPAVLAASGTPTASLGTSEVER
jgi:hypothetical protein